MPAALRPETVAAIRAAFAAARDAAAALMADPGRDWMAEGIAFHGHGGPPGSITEMEVTIRPGLVEDLFPRRSPESTP